jgi:CHAT domain-containing protein
MDIIQSALNDLGNLYMAQSDFAKATGLFTRSLSMANRLGDREAAAITTCNLGVSSERQGMYEPAGQSFSDCLRLANEAARLDLTIPALEGLGSVYRQKGQQELSLEHYDRALQTAIELSDKSRQSELLWRKARLYHDLRKYEASIALSEQSWRLADEIHKPNFSYLALTLIGKNHLALGHYDLASSTLARAIENVEGLRKRVGGQHQQRASFFETKIEPYCLMVDLLLAENKPEQALELAERARSRTLLDLFGSAKFDINGIMSREDRAAERKLEGRLIALNSQLFRENQQKDSERSRINTLKADLVKARIDYDSFLDKLYASYPELKVDRVQVLPFSIQDANAALVSEDAVAVEFQVLDDKVHVFTIELSGGAPRIATYPIVISRKTLSEKVEQFRGRISNNSLGVDKLSRELFQLLLGPSAHILSGKKTIVVVPDDVLWELPFQALKNSSGQYLIESHPLFYVPSLTALREIMTREARNLTDNGSKSTVRRHTSSGPSLLAFGNPKLSAGTISQVKTFARNEKLGPIPETKIEVATLGGLYGASRSKLFVGEDATEDRAKAEMSQFEVLHFATHGVLDGKDPLYSNILLSRSGPEGDGLLEAREIMKLNLAADIAILSACDTARGRISGGEGVIGMMWALFVAGCPTTVVSQWSVESRSTTKLMIEFHRALLGLNKQSERMKRAADALREAQLKMLKSQVYRHPFYWAGFVVVGNGW